MYYLQSRYYDPSTVRFINADSYASTGQSVIGYNMFAYCGNSPVMFVDSSGTRCVYVKDFGGGSSTLLSTLCFKDYLYPFNRNVEFTCFAVLDIPEENSLSGPGSKFWHAAYEEFGFFSESMYFCPLRRHQEISKTERVRTIPQSKTDYLTSTIEKLEPMRYNLGCCIGSFSHFLRKELTNWAKI